MAKKLTHNLGLKILAVLASIILWFIAININDPMSTNVYNVTVQLENLDKLVNNNKYVEVLDNTDTVRVTVRATRSELKEINDKNITAVADVDKMTEGNYIPIELSCNKASVTSNDLTGDKEYVKVNVENIKRRQLPITVATQGEPGEGYMLGGTSTAQNAVMLSGPESLISRISTVSVDIDIEGAESDVNISLPIHLYDADGREITDSRINKSINDVSTTASIWLIKGVPVEYKYVGEPAEGYMVQGNISADINYITIAGKASILKNIQKIDVNEAIDVTGASRDIESYIDLRKQLPDGVSFAEVDAATKTEVSLRIIKAPTEDDENGETQNEEE